MGEAKEEVVRGQLLILFLVTFIDMIGFGIVIPFLTYLVEDLAVEANITSIGLWVGLVMTPIPWHSFSPHRFGAACPTESVVAPSS